MTTERIIDTIVLILLFGGIMFVADREFWMRVWRKVKRRIERLSKQFLE